MWQKTPQKTASSCAGFVQRRAKLVREDLRVFFATFRIQVSGVETAQVSTASWTTRREQENLLNHSSKQAF